MPYPFHLPGKSLFPGFIALFLTVGAAAAPASRILSTSLPAYTPKHPENTLYRGEDTTLTASSSRIVHKARNGDIIIAIPANALGRYRVRFFDEKDRMLFEIRQIGDPLLIIEKYNFGHAGRFRYELYRDNVLAGSSSFSINP